MSIGREMTSDLIELPVAVHPVDAFDRRHKQHTECAQMCPRSRPQEKFVSYDMSDCDLYAHMGNSVSMHVKCNPQNICAPDYQ